MNRLDRLNLVLGLLLALLLWFGLQPPTTEIDPPLLKLAPSEVKEIRVIRGKRLVLGLLRDRQGWMLSHPEIARAAPLRVQELLALARAPVRWRATQSPPDLASFGLAEPLLEVSFDQHRIRFGNASTPPGQRYVESAGQLLLIDEAFYRIAGLPARHFLENR